MEALGVQSDLVTKMSNICWILPYYDYAYESVKILRSLCQQTRELWINEQDVIIRMLEKQTIFIQEYQPIDEKTIEALQRGHRYKLFKLNIEIDDDWESRSTILKTMVDEMPELEI